MYTLLLLLLLLLADSQYKIHSDAYQYLAGIYDMSKHCVTWSGIQVSRAYTRSHFFLTFCSL